jgi:hypothetical protein
MGRRTSLTLCTYFFCEASKERGAKLLLAKNPMDMILIVKQWNGI